MYIIISIILLLVALLLIAAVLIQPGKGDMLTGMSGLGGQFNSVLGSRRATDLLSKITWTLATAIIVLTLVTNLFFLNSGGQQLKAPTEGMKVSQPMSQPAATPVAPATTPAESEQKTEESK
jgi:preprotein translocase subunit SecG